MRILQLEASAGGSEVVDLHPRLSVVLGLAPEGRERVLGAIAGVPAGTSAGTAGLIEAHGILLDLNDANLDLLDLRTPLHNVLRSADVPGALDPTELRRAVERHLLSWPTGREPALDAARTAYEAAKQACDALRAEATEAREALHRASRDREEAQGQVGHLSADLDPFSEQKLQHARDALAAIEAELGLRGSEPPESRIARITQRIAEIDAELAALPTGDTSGVARALALVNDPPQGGTVEDPDAQRLADEVDALQADIVRFEESLADEGISLSKAMAELEESRAELIEAEARMARREATDEERIELESVHDQIQDLEPKTDSRIGGAKARKQVEELLVRERAILDRLGYRSWTEYIMGSSLIGIDPEAENRVERARIDVEVREGRWVRLTERLESEPAYKEMLDRLEAVYLAAFDMLEGREPDDLSGTLRALTIEVPPMTALDAASELWDALEEAGVELEGDELPFEAIVAAAEGWLRDVQAATVARPRLEAERVTCESQLADAEAELADAEAGIEKPEEIPDDPQWAAAMAAVNGAEARHQRHLATQQQVAPLQEQLDHANEIERAAQDEVDARQARVDEAAVQERATRAALDEVLDVLTHDPEVAEAIAAESGAGRGPDREELEMFLLSTLTGLRAASYAGSVPLAIDGILDQIDIGDAHAMLARLERLSDAVQVVVFTDSDELAMWADALGIEHAAVVEVGPAL